MSASNSSHRLAEMLNEGGRAFERGDYLEAIRIWEQILVASPSWDKGRLHRSLAKAYQNAGEFEKARIKFLEALSFNSEDVETRDDFAYLLWKHGDPKQAFDQYLMLAASYRRQHAPADWIESLMVPLNDLGLRIGIPVERVRSYLEPSGEDSAGTP